MAKIENSLPSSNGGSQLIERTSQLINDGENGMSHYVELEEVLSIVNDIILDGGGDKHYTHDQGMPSDTWEIVHGLNKKPSVTITDSAGTVVEGAVVINDGVRVLIKFNAPFSGIAICN